MRRTTPLGRSAASLENAGRIIDFPDRRSPPLSSGAPELSFDVREYDVHLRVAPGDLRLAADREAARRRAWPAHPDEETLLHVLPGALLFDPAFYAAQAGEVAWPRTHYMTQGWRLGYDPHPLFSTDHYLARLGRPLARDPLFDFLTRGRFEGAEVHPLFSNTCYLANRPDVAAAGVHPLVHYIEYGWREGVRGACRWFDEDAYERQTPGLAEAGIIPVAHYLARGWREGRTPSPQFLPSLLTEVGAVERRREPLTRFLIDLESGPLLQSAPDPRVSVIILNLNKPLLTLSCLRTLSLNTDLSDVEVIVVDNGSHDEQFADLARHAAGVRLLRLSTNVGFGEANNIAVEAAYGETLVFLNNDAFVTPGWLPAMSGALEPEDVGVVGALLLYPDGLVQEAGAFLSADGAAHQFGKGLEPDFEPLTRQADVHYVSAAASMVKRSVFEQVGGFDLCWDPAYYEDADLCLKVRSAGKRIVFTPEARVYHLEHATSSDTSLNLRLHDIVEVNRLKFIARWGGWLLNPGDPPPKPPPPVTRPRPKVQGSRRRAVLHTPFSLSPGGGERYLLTLAEVLSADHDVHLSTSAPNSRLRLNNLGRDLGLDLGQVHLICDSADPIDSPDLLIVMSNECLPPTLPRGRVNIHHCQFPFPMDAACMAKRWPNAHGWQAVVVNSEFTRDAYRRETSRLGLPCPPVHVLHPPVPQIPPGPRSPDGVRRILNVGRFFLDGHCKRQDRLVDAFRRLTLRLPDLRLELHLAGAVGSAPQDREYLRHVRRLARGLPIRFHINIPQQALAALYADARLYWHATGLGENIRSHPERFEHFGITVLEAMSAGAVPLALDAGGPKEVIRHGREGWLYGGEDELVELSFQALRPSSERAAAEMSRLASIRAAAFSPDRFRAGLRRMLSSIEGGAA